MLLDMGNTAVKWAVRERGRATRQGRFVYRDREFGACAGAAWEALPAQTNIAVANVAGPGIAQALTDWTESRWRATPKFLCVSREAAGVTNAYPEPATLGVDRWAAMIAAFHDYGGPVCIVDCGTAITVDVVAADGRHQGGLILPGVGLLKQALLRNTAGIRPQGGGDEPPVTLLACGTREAVHSGVHYTCSTMLDRLVADIVTRFGEATGLVITGGDAESLQALTQQPLQHVPDLVLRGVEILAGEKTCVM